MRDDQIPIRLRRFGPADPYIDQCIESALDSLDEALFVEPGQLAQSSGAHRGDRRSTHARQLYILEFHHPGPPGSQ
jgi:hypothetical protein